MLLKDIKATTLDGLITHNQVPQMASLELAFELYNIENDNVDEVTQQMETRGVPLPLAHNFEISALSKMSSEMIKVSMVNIKRAREDFVLCLHHQFPPREGQPLYEWMQEGERYKNGYHLEANNFETHPTSRKVVLSMTAVFIL